MNLPITDGADCLRAWEAMPAVLLERAPLQLSDWLERHLALCNSCRDAFDQQRRLRLILALPTNNMRVDANVGLRRLLNRIGAPVRPDWLQRGLLAAVLIQAVGLPIVVARPWPVAGASLYGTLSQEPAAIPAGTIRVVPDAAMALTDWNALLHVLHLRVVGGPDAAGAYIVVPMDPRATTRHALLQLRAARGVRLAEAVAGAR